MKRLFRWILVLFLIGLAAGWFVMTRMDGLLREKLLAAAAKALGDRYEVSIGDLSSEPWRGTVALRDLAMIPRGDLPMDMNGYALDVRADRVALEGLSYWALLKDGRLQVEAVRLIAPRVVYTYRPHDHGDSTTATLLDKASVAEPKGIPTGEGSIGRIELRDASGMMRRTDQDSTVMSIDDLDILLSDLVLVLEEGGETRWQLGSSSLDMHGVRAGLPPLYDAVIDSIALSYPARTAKLSGVRLRPRKDRDHYRDLVSERSDLFDISLTGLEMFDIDLSALRRHRAVRVGKVKVQGGHLYIDTDGRLQAKAGRPRTLPTSGLRAMNVAISIDSLEVGLHAFRYGERGANAEGYGDIEVTSPHVIVTGVRTGAPLSSTDTLRVAVIGKLYGQGRVDARYSAAYAAADDAFEFKLLLGGMDFKRFGELTKDLLKAAPVEGRIHQLVMRMNGNSSDAELDLLLTYDGLALDVMPEKGLAGKLFTGAANLAVIHANPSKGDAPRRVRLRLPRRTDRTISHYLVGGLKTGAIRTLLPERLADAALEHMK